MSRTDATTSNRVRACSRPEWLEADHDHTDQSLPCDLPTRPERVPSWREHRAARLAGSVTRCTWKISDLFWDQTLGWDCTCHGTWARRMQRRNRRRTTKAETLAERRSAYAAGHHGLLDIDDLDDPTLAPRWRIERDLAEQYGDEPESRIEAMGLVADLLDLPLTSLVVDVRQRTHHHLGGGWAQVEILDGTGAREQVILPGPAPLGLDYDDEWD